MSSDPDNGNSRCLSPLGTAVLGLWTVLIVAFVVQIAPSLYQKYINHRNVLGVLKRSERLPAEGRRTEMAYRVTLAGDTPIFVGLSPDRHSWYTVSRSGDRIRVTRYRERLGNSVKVASTGEASRIRVYRSGQRLDVQAGEGHLGVELPEGWRWWRVNRDAGKRAMEWQSLQFRSIRRTDSFQRQNFGHGDRWTVEQGDWRILTRGGGAGKSANAFMLEGSSADGRGSAYTGWKTCASYEVQVSVRSAAEGVLYRLVAGNSDAGRLSFGWNGKTRRWEVKHLPVDGPPRVLYSRRVMLPEGNWHRFGLRLASPFQAVILLDGAEWGPFELPEPVYGRVRLQVERGTVHFDDFRMQGRSSTDREWTPLYVESKSFGDKPIKDNKDEDFVKWAHDTLCYDTVGVKFGNHWYPSLRYRVPLYGDFTYRGEPGRRGPVFIRLENEAKWRRRFDFYPTSAGWQLGQPGEKDNRSDESPEPLQLSYRDGVLRLGGEDGRRLTVLNPDPPLRIAVCTPQRSVDPADHQVRSQQLWNELFQTAPVDWTWWSGEFGMQSRWACQPYWNFMGGWSRQYAAAFSRTSYHGDQTIEYYISMKDLIRGVNKHRYMRRDLNFSFCTDGKSPSSGYSLLFGGFGTGATYLMKGEKVLASTEEFKLPRFVNNHHDVHWRWWHFRVEKRGGRIRVFGDEKKIFDVRDDDPLSGGHIGFWTVEDGFMLARIRIAAERRQRRPERSWEKPSGKSDTWERLDRGNTEVSQEGNWTKLVNRASGGSLGLRWRGGPVDLRKTPVLRLPIEIGESTRVNLHIQVSGRSYIVPLTAPTQNTGQLLTPAWSHMTDKAFFWRLYNQRQLEDWRFLEAGKLSGSVLETNLLKALGNRIEGDAILEGLSIGNTSNHRYLLGGFGGNGTGAHYRVGKPRWVSATVAEGK